MSSPDTFFLKSGYVCNDAAAVCDPENVARFWTPQRIRLSAIYQYHVYRLAGAIARKHGFRAGLDIGCGTAVKAAKFLAPVLHDLVLMDQENCRDLVAARLPDATFIAADLESCGAPLTRCVDLVVCADVLEHLSSPVPCLEFARDHLAPDGIAVFSTPERDTLRGRDCNRCMHDGHVREWNLEEFRCLLEWKGFRVIRQLQFPAQRLSLPEELALTVLPARLAPARWRHCQVAVCTR